MPKNLQKDAAPAAATNFDFFRLSKAKQMVDLAPNTIRAWSLRGLRLHRRGKVVFVSKTELGAFILAGK
jgi:hypothetical protein